MKFIDDAIKESEERMEKVDSKKAITSDIDEDLIGFIKKTNIYVVGAGGAGNNTISRLNDIGIEGADTITVNTDAQDLYYSQSDKKILLGRKTSGGLGAGGDPSIGEEIIAIGGRGHGVDSAVILTPANAKNLFDLKFHEIIAMPRD